MKKVFSMVLLWAMFVSVTGALAGGGLEQVYIARDQSYQFAYPDDWNERFDDDYQTVVVFNDDLEMYVFGPADTQNFELPFAPNNAEDYARALAIKWDGIVRGDIQTLVVGDYPAARVDFVFHNAPGFFLVLGLGGGAFAIFEPFGQEGVLFLPDEAIIFQIAETFEVLGDPLPDAILNLQDAAGVTFGHSAGAMALPG